MHLPAALIAGIRQVNNRKQQVKPPIPGNNDIYCRILPTRTYNIGAGNTESLQAKALLLPAVFGTVYLYGFYASNAFAKAASQACAFDNRA